MNGWSRERVAVAAHFAVFGLVCATWSSSIDDMKVLLGLDDAQQGWLLFSGPVGNLISYTFASALVTRLGSRFSLCLSVIAYAASALGLGACFLLRAPVPCWCVAITSLSATGTIYNISVNTQGGIVERKSGRTIMNSFHAMFSTLGFVAGLLALSASSLDISAGWRLLAVVVVMFAVHVACAAWLPAENDSVRKEKGSGMRRPDAALLVLGVAALVVLGCEGSINNWVNVFFRDSLGAPSGRVKWGFCAVCATMMLGRFVTDGFINRFGSVRVFRVYSVLVALGLGIALSSPFVGLQGLPLHVMATAGYAVAGFGVSALVPIIYSKANKSKSMPAASALTFVGSMGFLGYLVGPPMIGHVASATCLSVALGIFAVLVLVCLFLRMGDD